MVLCALSCLWIAVVGLTLVNQLTPDDMENHRSQMVQEQVRACPGDFAERYDCTEAILLKGERSAITEVVKRLGAALILPGFAWAVWWRVLRSIRQIYWLPPPSGRFRSFVQPRYYARP